MSITAQQLVNRALSRIGALSEGESASAARSAEILADLNTLLDSWRLDEHFVSAESTKSFTMAAGDPSYTIAVSGADIAQERPVELLGGYTTDASGNDSEFTLLTEDEYAAIGVKTTRGRPYRVLYRPASPLATLLFYPVPDAAYTAVLRIPTVLTSFADLTTEYSLAPGYERAILLNLALEECPSEERDARQVLQRQATDALMLVREKNRKNIGLPLCKVELASVGRSGFRLGDDIYSV